MEASFTAAKSITLNAAPAQVWDALTNPEIVKQYMFGAEVVSDWQKGSPIVYKGNWQGTPYEDKGIILEIEPQKLLKATYFSAMSGLDDKPENYNVITYELQGEGDGPTTLTVTQANNKTQEAADEAGKNWATTLETIKKILE